MYGQILNVIAPIFAITAVGYLLGRFNSGIDARTLSTLVLLIATPSLVFSKLTSLEIETATVATMALAAAGSVALATVLSVPILRLTRLPIRTFLPSLIMPNSGNIGLPVALLAFGDRGLVLGISYFFVIALLQYSLGAAISSSAYRPSDLARQPLVYSVVLVVIVMLTGFQVPAIVATTTDLLGGMMIPAMLILLGTSLARLSVSDLGPALTVAVARLGVGLVTGVAIVWGMGLSGVAAGTVFLMAAMPAAIINFVLAERYRPDGRQVAGVVVVSTLLTFALLPVLLWVALRVAGGAL